jgi:uncharacterized membrane protein SirB2
VIEFYPQIKFVHVAAVFSSGILFAFRGMAVQFGAAWAMAAPPRYLSYTIDTVLLTAALMLASILHVDPFVQTWLAVKIVLLVVYVALGSMALKRARTRGRRLVAFAAALLVYGYIISVARAHDPWGVFAFLR